MPRYNVEESETQEAIAYLKDRTSYYGKLFIELFGIYVVWIMLHYVSAHLYIQWCTPLTLWGFLMSPFIVPAPHCQALRWAMNNGSTTITAMWVTLGSWLVKKLIV
jgi:hypothetical protein